MKTKALTPENQAAVQLKREKEIRKWGKLYSKSGHIEELMIK